MARDPQEYARAQSKNPTPGDAGVKSWAGQCLAFVSRAILGTGSGFGSANEAYLSAASRPDTWHSKDKNPPRNVPVYWSGGKSGHAALSAGGSMVWTTDYTGARTGEVKLKTIESVTKGLGSNFTYQGWSSTYGTKGEKSPERVPNSDARPGETDDRVNDEGFLDRLNPFDEIGEGFKYIHGNFAGWLKRFGLFIAGLILLVIFALRVTGPGAAGVVTKVAGVKS